jgi:16S rRNA processing protein RimM
MASDPAYLIIGQIVRPHGIRGELRLQVLTNYPERLTHLTEIVLCPQQQPHHSREFKRYEVENARLHHDQAILKLAGLDDRTQAEGLRHLYALVPLDQAVPLEEDEYYHYQLIGLEMVTEEGQLLGHVTDILETGANDVYILDSPQYGELLIPAIEQVVQVIDLTAKRITVRLLPGLLPDEAEDVG